MSLEYKIDELTRNILLLSAKTEQRHQQSEQQLQVSQTSLQKAEAALDKTAQEIYRITAKVVQDNLEQPIKKLEKQCEVIGENLKGQMEYAQKGYLHTLETLKKLIWCAVTAFVLAAIVCVISIVFIFQASKQNIKKAEWTEEINRVVANGSLNRCDAVHQTIKSGLCVKIKDKWTPIK